MERGWRGRSLNRQDAKFAKVWREGRDEAGVRFSLSWGEIMSSRSRSEEGLRGFGLGDLCQEARAMEAAGWMWAVSFCRSLARARKSHSTWMACQNSADWPKNAPNRMDMAGVMERRAWMISLMARGATPMARAMAFWDMPMGSRYSSRRISPGVMGGFMTITYSVMGVRQW